MASDSHTLIPMGVGKPETFIADIERAYEAAKARTAYIALFADLAAAVAFEDSCLSAGDEFLPEHARAVREDNSTATPEYYAWLSEQAEQAGAVYNAAE